ncbi:MAG: hypothetical protein HWN68_10260 [Desulfobacterales bacterium]|nr:hypothetical protein [Desulfobacterales bacterium]
MAGYILLEEKQMQPFKPKGFPPNTVRMGFLDYVRELRQETFPFPEGHKLLLVGLEEVLIAAGNNLQEVEGLIHHILARKANEMEKGRIKVQIVFRSPLKSARDFWFEVGAGKRISLQRIFDSPPLKSDLAGNEYYFVGFNLT